MSAAGFIKTLAHTIIATAGLQTNAPSSMTNYALHCFLACLLQAGMEQSVHADINIVAKG
jgi:hypothetical protein